MSNAETSTPPAGHARSTSRRAIRLALTLAAMGGLLWFIGLRCLEVWKEWTILRGAEARVRLTGVVGYPGISPRYSYAQRPADWIHDDGDATLLWGGWKPGHGHQWFRVGLGELEPQRISSGLGRDTVQVIDVPIVEREGDVHWARIPDEAEVAGHRLGGIDSVYPLLVLDKVIAVNDTIADRPVLVTFNPSRSRAEQVGVYDPIVEGRRVTMGMSGYFYANHPLLFDRGTESLWVGDEDDAGLVAIAGRLKGATLRRLARPVPTTWSRWRAEHPDSRLVVGADRSRPTPEL